MTHPANRPMPSFFIMVLLAFFGLVPRQQVGAAPEKDARSLVRTAIEAMGGEARLRSAQSISFKAIGQRTMLEQSERPEGPWYLDDFQVSETLDFAHNRLREERQSRGCGSTECWKSAEWSPSTRIYADGTPAAVQQGRTFPGRADFADESAELLALGPTRVLLNALAATDLRLGAPVSLHGFAHQVVQFSWNGSPVRVFLNSYSGLPTAVEITRPRPHFVFWGVWGDVTTRVTFGFWTLEPGGLRFPRQWDFESNGQPDWMWTINELALNPSVAEEQFTIPEDVRKKYPASVRTLDDWPLGISNDPAEEIAPGVFQVRGFWNIAEVRQPDGVVIIEGPISNGYSAKVIADAEKRFPGARIKAVVTTSDSWPHIGGLREYAARGVPIYALDLNRAILERLLAAPHLLRADALAEHPRKPIIHYVTEKTILGNGATSIELIPFREQTGERQMMVYFPGAKLLYSSDLFQRQGAEWFLPQTLSEAVDAVRREKLAVERAFGMHYAPAKWEEIVAAVNAAVNAPAKSVQDN